MKHFPILTLLTFYSLCFLHQNLSAQDIHFSQYFLSPQNLNPALTGIIDSKWRFISNLRTQGKYYNSPLNTLNISYDHAIQLKNSSGYGFQLTHDYSTGITSRITKFSGSYAKLIRISRHSFLGAGLQAGLSKSSISYSKLSFPEQYDRNSGGYNSHLPLSENFPRETSYFFDVNFGLLYKLTKPQYVFQSGLALFHINQPSYYFIDKHTIINIRTNWHGSLKYKLNPTLHIIPQSYFTYQNGTSEWIFGTNFSFENIPKKNHFKGITIGAHLRNGIKRKTDSLIMLLGTKYNNWSTYISFDFDIANNKTKNYFNNAVELTLVHNRPFAFLNKTTIPCIRY